MRTQWKDHCVGNRRWALTRQWIYWCLDPDFPEQWEGKVCCPSCPGCGSFVIVTQMNWGTYKSRTPNSPEKLKALKILGWYSFTAGSHRLQSSSSTFPRVRPVLSPPSCPRHPVLPSPHACCFSHGHLLGFWRPRGCQLLPISCLCVSKFLAQITWFMFMLYALHLALSRFNRTGVHVSTYTCIQTHSEVTHRWDTTRCQVSWNDRIDDVSRKAKAQKPLPWYSPILFTDFSTKMTPEVKLFSNLTLNPPTLKCSIWNHPRFVLPSAVKECQSGQPVQQPLEEQNSAMKQDLESYSYSLNSGLISEKLS